MKTFLHNSIYLIVALALIQRSLGQGVGINQTSPVSMLDVNGGITVGSTYSGTNAAPADGMLIEGSVGIGTTTVTRKLTVSDAGIPALFLGTGANGALLDLNSPSATDAAIRFQGSSNWTVGHDAGAGALVFANFNNFPSAGSDASKYLAITTGGKVGIGTVAPGNTLHINDDIGAGGDDLDILRLHRYSSDKVNNQAVELSFYLEDSNNNPAAGYSASIKAITMDGGTVAGEKQGDLAFTVVDDATETEAVHIRYDGNVGIQNSAPAALLDVGASGGTDGEIRVISSAGRTAVLEADDAGNFIHVGSASNHDFQLVRNDVEMIGLKSTGINFKNASGTTRMTMLDAGNFGIGSTSPATALDVNGDITTDNLFVRSTGRVYWEGDVNQLTNNDGGGNVHIYMGAEYNGGYKFTHGGGAAWITSNIDNAVAGSEYMDLRVSSNAGSGDATAVTWGSALRITPTTLTFGGNQLWDANNDGSGSGLDADLLDGISSAGFIQNQTASDQAAGFRINGNGIFNGGSVGIGSTSPSTALDIVGELTINSTALDQINLIGTDGNNDGYSIDSKTALSSNDTWLRLNNAGEFTSGTFTPGNLRTDGELLVGASGARFVVKTSGYVGIDKTNPVLPLDITGTEVTGIRYLKTGSKDARIQVGDPTKTWAIASGWSAAGDFSIIEEGVDGDHFYIQQGGNIGFGTTAPGSEFELYKTDNPSFRITDGGEIGEIGLATCAGCFSNYATSGDLVIRNFSGSGADVIIDAGSATGAIRFGTGVTSTEKMTIANNGDVGIGTSGPNFKLDVRGTIGNNATTYHSDERWKKNISSITSGLDKVLAMRGVTYDWRVEEFPEMAFEEGTKYGFIAQEIEEVIPELVITGADGYKSVHYANISAVLVEAIKEQQITIETQQETIQELLNRIQALERMVVPGGQ